MLIKNNNPMFGNYNAWKIDVNDFPSEKSIEDKIKFLIGFGILAPSSHNTQPWKTSIENNSLKVFINNDLRLPYSDPTGRMIYITMGAFIKNILIAANYYGLEVSVKYNDNLLISQPEEVVVLEFNNSNNENLKGGSLMNAILSRATYRAMYPEKSIPDSTKKHLNSLNNNSDVKLNLFFKEKDKIELSKIVGEGMKDKMSPRDFRWELASWIRNNATWRRDGMNGAGHEMSFLVSVLAPFALRFIDVSSVERKKAIKRVKNFPGVAIITAKKDNAMNWVKTGVLMQDTILNLEKEGMRASILVAGVESDKARNKMFEFLRDHGIEELPQMFFGFGFPQKNIVHSPRKGVDDVIMNKQSNI